MTVNIVPYMFSGRNLSAQICSTGRDAIAQTLAVSLATTLRSLFTLQPTLTVYLNNMDIQERSK